METLQQCDDIQLLFYDYVTGRISNPNRKIVDEHLSTCEIC